MANSSNKSEQWVVKNEQGQVKGPYSTDAVIKMILSGIFNGAENICGYPDGEWRSLTKQPEFYDALIESLENPAEADEKRTQKMEAETVIQPAEKPDFEDQFQNEAQSQDGQDLSEEKLKEDVFSGPLKPLSSPKQPVNPVGLAIPSLAQISKESDVTERDKNLIIQLKSIKQIQQHELKKFIPFMAAIVVVILVGVYFLWGMNDLDPSGWVLLAPKTNANGSISTSRVKEIKKQVVLSFQSGILENILKNQKLLIEAIEGDERDLESMGLLCVAHEILWPYTRQTIKDMKSITQVMQLTRQVNPISKYAQTCQISYLMAKGQIREAKALTEKTLDNNNPEKYILSPFLYVIKGEILEYELNFPNAGAYYDQATKLWPQWLWAKFGLARMLLKQNNYLQARDEFQSMLAMNKEYKAALMGLGLTELKGFSNQDKSYQFFSAGYSLKQTLPKDFIIEALFNYANLLINNNQRSKALDVAQEAYKINPSHRGIKELVLSLGGNDKIENAQTELVLLGDQFARTGDYLAAVAQYKAAFELDPTNALAAFKAGKGLWSLNQSHEAILWLGKAIKADPKMVSAYVLKADYESQRYEFADAAKTLESAARYFPKNHEIFKGQALLEFRKNNIMAAIQYGERAVKIYDADVELLTLLAQAKLIQYQANVGVKNLSQEEKNAPIIDAKRYAGRAKDLEPNWPEAEITYAKFVAVDMGTGRAEIYLKDLIKNNPYTLEYRIALAEFYTKEEKYSDAANIYAQVVEIDPKSKKANFGLAESYRVLGKYDLAQKYYNATSMLDPSDVEPMFANAKLVLESATGRDAQTRINQALAKFNVVKNINKNFPRVSYYLAKCYLDLGDYNKAAELINEEKANNPFLADPYILSAQIFERKQQYKECAAEYSAASRLRPGSADLYVRAAICYRKSNAVDIAEDMLAIAKQKESGFVDIYREQGYIFEITNQREQAVESWKKYLELSPNAPDRSLIESKIRELGG